MRCGEEHIDDPYYEHVCEGEGGMMAYIDRFTKPEGRCTTASALTHQHMEDMYRQAMMYGRPGRVNTEIVDMRRHEAEVALRMRQEAMERFRRTAQVEPPRGWTDRIFRNAQSGLRPDTRDARDYQVFYDEATS